MTARDLIQQTLNRPHRTLLDAGPSPRSLHRLALWLRCAQLYAWTYLAPMEYRPKKRRKALNRGSLTHLGTAHAYTRAKLEEEGGDPETLYTAEEAIEIKAGQMAATEPPPLIEVEKQTALAVLKAYKRQVALDLDRYRVVEVEKIVWFCVSGVWYTQRLDLLLEDRANGLLYITDHKSSANPTSNTFSGFAPSLQMQGYRWWGPQMFGERWGGLFVNVLGFEKDATTGELKTTVDRRLVEPAPQLVARFPQTIIDVEAEIAAYAAQGRRYDQYPPVSDEVVCVHRYGRCEAFDLCLTGATKRDPNFPLVSLDVDSFVEGD